MKVFNLQCEHGHGFEGWFGSEADHADQSARGLIECPLCGSPRVEKRPSAPRLNLSGARAPAEAPAASAGTVAASAGSGSGPRSGAPHASRLPAPTPEQQSVEALWMRAVRHVMASTEDVGPRFAEEARRIHHGESPERGIRGQTSPEERAALREEGIEVHSLPLPAALKGPTH